MLFLSTHTSVYKRNNILDSWSLKIRIFYIFKHLTKRLFFNITFFFHPNLFFFRLINSQMTKSVHFVATLDNICCYSVISSGFSHWLINLFSFLDPCPRVLHVDVLPDLLRWEAFALTDLVLPVLHKRNKKVLSKLVCTAYWEIQKMNYRLPLPKVDKVHKISKYRELYWLITTIYF